MKYAATLAMLVVTMATPLLAEDATSAIYKVTARPLADRVDFEIALDWTPAPGEPLTIGPVQDCYGTPDLARGMTDLQARDGTTLASADGDANRTVTPNAQGVVRLSYRLTFDPMAMEQSPFSPNTGPGHFHMANCQWMLRLGDPRTERRYEMSLRPMAEDWRAYSSGGTDPGHVVQTGTFNQIVSTALGASNGAYRRFVVEGRPVDVFASDDIEVSAEDTLDMVERIVRVQRDWMNDYDFDRYTVVVRRRAGVTAGTAIPGLFVAFVRPDISATDLKVILSHEMFHNWLMGRMTVFTTEGSQAARLDWLNEGFTEYLARRALLEAELIDESEFVELFNADLATLANHPHGAATLAEAQAAADERRFDGVWKRLGYVRGALIGLGWDARLAGRSDLTVRHIVRNQVSTAMQTGGRIALTDVLAAFDAAGAEASEDDRRHIIEGAPIVPPGEAMGPNWRLTSVNMPSWAPGFDLRATFASQTIAGVEPDGPAWRAGLRDGMVFVNVSNSARYTNGYRSRDPMSVTIRDDNGEERQVSYAPEGPPISVWRFVPANE